MFLISSDDKYALRASAVTAFTITEPAEDDKDNDFTLVASFPTTYVTEGEKTSRVLGYYLMYDSSRDLCEAVRDEILNMMSNRPSLHVVRVAEVVARLRPIYDRRTDAESVQPEPEPEPEV